VEREIAPRAAIVREKLADMEKVGNRHALLHVLTVVPGVEDRFGPRVGVGPDATLAMPSGGPSRCGPSASTNASACSLAMSAMRARSGLMPLLLVIHLNLISNRSWTP
jgi:hypothetical protein